jgi:antitoxin component YwqK of YwqJK toxin-antitoxin module
MEWLKYLAVSEKSGGIVVNGWKQGIQHNTQDGERYGYYINDKVHGFYYRRNRDGTKYEAHFRYGIRHGTVLAYDHDGGLLSDEYNYENGEWHGKQYFYRADGTVENMYNYTNGMMDKYQYRYDDGIMTKFILFDKGKFVNGFKLGPGKTCYLPITDDINDADDAWNNLIWGSSYL